MISYDSKHPGWDFLDDNPWVVGALLLGGFLVVFFLLIGNFVGNQKTEFQAACESIGGVYGGNSCFVEGSATPLEGEQDV